MSKAVKHRSKVLQRAIEAVLEWEAECKEENALAEIDRRINAVQAAEKEKGADNG